MKTVQCKTNELTGAALDWAVAKADPQCAGLEYTAINGVLCGIDPETDQACIYFAQIGARILESVRAQKAIGKAGEYAALYSPSNDWKKAGMLIRHECIGISPPTSRVHRNGGPNSGWGESGVWTATTWHKGANGRRSIAWHETSPLIAAMRCYVASKLGESIDVPQHVVAAAQQTQGGE